MAPGSDCFGWDWKLRKTDDFSSVFRFKCAQRGQCIDVLACPNHLVHPRLGLVVPKKILARAVDRNRVKRILREVFRLRQRTLGGMDMIVRVKKGCTPAEYRTECESLILASCRCGQPRPDRGMEKLSVPT